MSTLKEEIKTAQIAAPPHDSLPFEAMDGRSSGLLFVLWDETEWLLPWAYFISAHYRPRVPSKRRDRPAPGKAVQPGIAQNGAAQSSAAEPHADVQPIDTVEQIELTYMNHIVVIQGRHLKPLMLALANMSLWVVRELAADFMEMQPEPASEASTHAVVDEATADANAPQEADESDESGLVITSVEVCVKTG
jgi:hypothetical protein